MHVQLFHLFVSSCLINEKKMIEWDPSKSESESTVAMHIVYELSRYIIFISLIRSSKYFF